MEEGVKKCPKLRDVIYVRPLSLTSSKKRHEKNTRTFITKTDKSQSKTFLKRDLCWSSERKQEYPDTTRTITSLNMVRVKKVEELSAFFQEKIFLYFIFIDKNHFLWKITKNAILRRKITICRILLIILFIQQFVLVLPFYFETL